MAKDEMIAKQIAEINQHIRDGVNQWADTMLMAAAAASGEEDITEGGDNQGGAGGGTTGGELEG